VRSVLTRDAVVYHYKPALEPQQFTRIARQARAQARTAKQFLEKHPHWRVALATGHIEPLLWLSRAARSGGWPRFLEKIAGGGRAGTALPLELRRWAAQRFARAEYYDELCRSEMME
jgi:hypothetical protein